MGLGRIMFVVATALHAAPAMAAAPDMVDIVRRAKPAVVSIEATLEPSPARPSGFGDEFDAFLAPERQHDRRSVGSGLVVDAGQGLILTTGFVIENAAQIAVTTASGDVRAARVVGVDALTGMAALQIAPGGLATLPLAVAAPEIGEAAIAVGQAYGFGVAATQGVVSLATLEVPDALGADYPDGIILADAAIHLGMAGGPLLNAKGEVIGIAAAAFGAGASPQGNLGIAIPVVSVRPVIDAMIAGKPLQRGWIGLGIEAAGSNRILVTDVTAGSPAAHAGLVPGDIITAVDGAPRTAAALTQHVARAAMGTSLRLDVERPRRRGSAERLQIDVTTAIASVAAPVAKP